MKAKVYYQDFSLNSFIFCKEKLKLDTLKAVFIHEFEWDKDKDFFVEDIFRKMNLAPIESIGRENEGRFIESGHTSMSVGDYIEFDDGSIWICASCGWEIR